MKYLLQRWPSTASVKRVKQRVKELTPRAACHRDLRDTIAKINPVIRGWGANSCASAKDDSFELVKWLVGRAVPSMTSAYTNCSERSVIQVKHDCRAPKDHR